MLVILWDSLRIDFSKHLHGIFPEETWGSFRTIAGFTAPVVAATITGKKPEELGLHRDNTDFWAKLDGNKIDDMLFDHFDSYISLGRLIGPPTRCIPLPPSRKEHAEFAFLPPIKWNAVSNWDIDIYKYFGMKWSGVSPYWKDLIWYHSFVTHGNFSIVDSKGAVESPEIKDGGRVMRNLCFNNPDGMNELYMQGVNNAIQILEGLRDICDNKETIICFADHGESFGPMDGMPDVGHFSGMEEHPVLGTVPLWINKKEIIPEGINNLNLKDWIVKMYEKYEKNNEEIQTYKAAKQHRKTMWGLARK
jgi:hypothetical protein